MPAIRPLSIRNLSCSFIGVGQFVPPSPSDNWILFNGIWDDAGIWDDVSNWID